VHLLQELTEDPAGYGSTLLQLSRLNETFAEVFGKTL
jgi:hypothetical protein